MKKDWVKPLVRELPVGMTATGTKGSSGSDGIKIGNSVFQAGCWGSGPHH